MELTELKHDLLRLKAQLLLAKGNWGHKGRPGFVGGSSKSGMDVVKALSTPSPTQIKFWERSASRYTFANDEVAKAFGMNSGRELSQYINDAFASGVKEADIFVRTSMNTFEKIIEDGRIKNQYEAKRSSAYYSPKTRKEFENEFFKIEGAKLNSIERPIYGYMSKKGTVEGVNQYGDVAIKLKVEVKNRTTVTLDDSLDRNHVKISFPSDGLSGTLASPTPATNPSKYSIPSNFQPQMVAEHIDSRKVFDVDSYSSSHSFFVEAQIHGGIKITDIESVKIPRGKLTPELSTKLHSLNISIEEY